MIVFLVEMFNCNASASDSQHFSNWPCLVELHPQTNKSVELKDKFIMNLDLVSQESKMHSKIIIIIDCWSVGQKVSETTLQL